MYIAIAFHKMGHNVLMVTSHTADDARAAVREKIEAGDPANYTTYELDTVDKAIKVFRVDVDEAIQTWPDWPTNIQ